MPEPRGTGAPTLTIGCSPAASPPGWRAAWPTRRGAAAEGRRHQLRPRRDPAGVRRARRRLRRLRAGRAVLVRAPEESPVRGLPHALDPDARHRRDDRSGRPRDGARAVATPPDRAFVPRHVFLGASGRCSSTSSRGCSRDGRFAFEGHVANTLEAEHERGEALEPANFEIADRAPSGSRSDRGAPRPLRRAARHERRRLLTIARTRDSASSAPGLPAARDGSRPRAASFLRAYCGSAPPIPPPSTCSRASRSGHSAASPRSIASRLSPGAARGTTGSTGRSPHAPRDRDWRALAHARSWPCAGIRSPPSSTTSSRWPATRSATWRAPSRPTPSRCGCSELPPALAFDRALELAGEVPA